MDLFCDNKDIFPRGLHYSLDMFGRTAVRRSVPEWECDSLIVLYSSECLEHGKRTLLHQTRSSSARP